MEQVRKWTFPPPRRPRRYEILEEGRLSLGQVILPQSVRDLMMQLLQKIVPLQLSPRQRPAFQQNFL